MYIDLMLIKKKNLWLLLTNEVNLFIFSFLFFVTHYRSRQNDDDDDHPSRPKKGETLSIISIWECYSDNVLNGLSCYENQESTMLCVCFFYYYW